MLNFRASFAQFRQAISGELFNQKSLT